TKLQQKIFQHIPERYAMTVMRRVMLRISEQVCNQLGIQAVITGESLGQVASQTLASMHTINEMTNIPVLRPLVSFDTEDIITHAKQIGTYDISIRPYEDCCTIFVPKSPATNPKRETVHKFEENVDFTEEIAEAVQQIERITIDNQQTSSSSFDELL